MSLIRKSVTTALVAANRSNSLKSTGPRTPLGKRRASGNARRHLISAKVVLPGMRELGEDPAEYQKLHESLRRSFGPRDGFEEMLVREMAENRWRLRRLMRAESGILAARRRDYELDREWKVATIGKDPKAVASDELLKFCGWMGLSDTPRKFERIVECLRVLKRSIELDGFKSADAPLLERVYGPGLGEEERSLMRLFRNCCEPPDGERSDRLEARREEFTRRLDEEIAAFERLGELARARFFETTEPMKDSTLLAREKDLGKIIRYEASLERQFQMKLRQLVAWRRAKEEATRPEGPATR